MREVSVCAGGEGGVREAGAGLSEQQDDMRFDREDSVF